MKSIKKNLILSAVVCIAFLMLSTGIIQPIQATENMKNPPELEIDLEKFAETLSNMSIDVQQVSENITSISAGYSVMTMETLENGYRLSTVLENGTTLCYEIIAELKPANNKTLENTSRADVPVQKIVTINGTEMSPDMFEPKFSPQPDASSLQQPVLPPYDMLNEPPNTRGGTTFVWDRVEFVGGAGVDYPHPNRAYYAINRDVSSTIIGERLIHYQMTKAASMALAAGGELAIIGGFGLMIEAGLINVLAVGSSLAGAVGLIVGAIVITALIYLTYAAFSDEEGCIWYWVQGSVLGWLAENAEYVVDGGISQEAVETVLNNGFLRIGANTYYDRITMGDPAVPPTPTLTGFALPVITDQTSIFGGSYVTAPNNMAGATGDGNFGYMYSGAGMNGKATVIASMINMRNSGQAQTGHVYLNMSSTNANSRMLVFGSMSSSGGWFSIANQVVTNTGTNYVFCGYVDGPFKYLSIVAFNSDGTPSYLNIDSIEVWNWL